MKGIILAGGNGSRLLPMTAVVSKQLLPVYDKPMIYYPLCTLMQAGVRDILIVTTPRHQTLFRELLGDGSVWGINLSYAVQPEPGGIAQALIIGRHFIGRDPCALILGDNIFHGPNFGTMLKRSAQFASGAVIFAYRVSDPKRYGVLDLDANDRPRAIVEKPNTVLSSHAVTGLYFYDGRAPDIAASLKPSARSELEITDLNNWYLERGELKVEMLDPGFAWLDMGTPESLLRASELIEAIQQRQGLKVGVPEEVAWRMGYIGTEQLARLAHDAADKLQGSYLQGLVNAEPRSS
jgi:glucose-1-phosphate thymidylyltransferase